MTYKDRNPFQGVIKVKGISKIHIMEVDGEKTSLWKNCALKANFQPADIILNNGESMGIVEELHINIQGTSN